MTRRTKRLWAIETDERDVSEAKMPPGWVEPLMGRLQMLLSHYLNYTADILESTQGTWVVGARLLVIFLQMFKRPTKAKKNPKQNKTDEYEAWMFTASSFTKKSCKTKFGKPSGNVSYLPSCNILHIVSVAFGEKWAEAWREVVKN